MSAERLATFTIGGRARYGAVTGKGVVDLGVGTRTVPSDTLTSNGA
ncbi:hypothetical protein [Mesorhizobium kowhaii]|nr:hypothetical protein [Mesorhizobium kowhaii]